MSGETKSNKSNKSAVIKLGKKKLTLKGNWKHSPDKENTKLPVFFKDRNDPLRMIYKGKRVNVLRGGAFTKTFRKIVRRAIKDGEKFRLPNIKTFRDFAINSKGNIVNKNNLKREYLHRITFTLEFSDEDGDLYTKQYNESYVSNKKKANKKIQKEKIDNTIGALQNEYEGIDVELVEGSVSENVNELLEPPAPTLIRGYIIPDSKFIDKDQTWNTKEGTCFYDYLKHLYATPNKNGKWNCKVPKALRLVCLHKKRCWEELNGCYGCFDEEHINWGVTADMIERFCRKFEINCYLINDVSEFIYYYTEGNKYTPSIVGQIANGHFNPITDSWKRKSLVSKTRAKKKAMKEKEKVFGKTDTKPPTMCLVPLPQDTKSNMFNLMVEKILETGITPQPYTLNFDEGHISGFMLNDVKYVYDTPDYLYAKLLAEEKNEPWDGKSIKGLGIEMFEKDDKIFSATSRMSPDLYELFTHKEVKDRSHRGFIDESMGNEVNTNIVGFDINKAYTDCVMNPYDRWIQVGFNSVWKPYKHKKDFDEGFYYVETIDTTLFHRNNIYSKCIVEYGFRKKIITKDNIKYYLNPVSCAKKTLFHNLFSQYLNISSNKKIGKFLCNLTTGLLGRSIRKKTNARISTEFSDVSTFYYTHKNPYCFSQAISQDKNIFIYGQKWEMPKIDNHIPMYIQILDNMNIRQYQMMKKFLKPHVFKNLYDYPIYRKVDMFACDKNYLRKNYQSKCSNKIGGYKMEIPKKFYNATYKNRGLNCVVCDDYYGGGSHITNTTQAFEKCLTKKEKMKLWKGSKIIDNSNDWEVVEKYMFGSASYDEEKNSLSINKFGGVPVCCILGDGGTGKSYIIKKISETHKPLKMCFTNKASLNIEGGTFHRQLGLNPRLEMSVSKLDSIAENYDSIIVDEISMNPAWAWNYIIWLKKLLKLPILLCGDWGQVRPVEKTKSIYDKYYLHPRIHNFITAEAELLVNHRIGDGQEEYAKLLHNNKSTMENINVTEFILDDDEPIPTKNICYLNKTRKRVNNMISELIIESKNIQENEIFTIEPKAKQVEKEEEQYIEEPNQYGVKLNNKKDDPTQTIKVFANTPMIARVTEDKGETLFNNEDFVIHSITKKETTLRSLNRKEDYFYKIETPKLQSKFLVAWAITTHKAQGQTIKEKIKIWDWGYMNTELRYTAMSRVTKRSDVFIEPEYKK